MKGLRAQGSGLSIALASLALTRVLAQTPAQQWDSIDAFTGHWGKQLDVSQAIIERASKLMRKEYGEETRRVSFGADDRWVTAQTLSFLSASTDYQTV